MRVSRRILLMASSRPLVLLVAVEVHGPEHCQLMCRSSSSSISGEGRRTDTFFKLYVFCVSIVSQEKAKRKDAK